ncbi:YpoC family protein [Planococcus lenghuensis]|uniref:YpoC-like domain-containing protein n=1 Tax=Planococcus lenghuensis TaxID=2213202 RepID=A0A1Q2KZH1_9BACL|nr:hypothetical protein [Planococcus lenghuensis]AQQ53600.1 hypothetical protein B0X71_11290 [Planococcus lenghuensis]
MPSQKLTENEIAPFFAEWAVIREQLISLHRERSRQAAVTAADAIALYECLLLHCAEYDLMPVNGKERLHFIKANSGNYAAFRQLDELFSEMKKKIAVKRSQLNNANGAGAVPEGHGS